MAKLLEGAWDCSNCLRVGIPGREKNCPTCGEACDPVLTPEEQYYLPDNAQEVSPEVAEQYFSDGPNWVCGHCGQANDGDVKFCGRCDRALDHDDTINREIEHVWGKSAEGVVFDPKPDHSSERVEADLDAANRLIKQGDTPRVMESITLPQDELVKEGPIATRVKGYEERAEERKQRPRTAVETSMDWVSDHKKPMIIGAAILSGLALLFWLIWALTSTKPIDLTIDSLSWKRQIEVQEYRTLDESGWSRPADAYNVDRDWRFHHYDKVLDHYKTETYTDYESVYAGQESYSYTCGGRTVNNGDGSFSYESDTCTGSRAVYESRPVTKTRQVAVYRDEARYQWYYIYNVDRWVHDFWETAQASDQSPEWPKVRALEPDQRQGAKTETYTVVLVDEKEKTYNYDVKLDTWMQLTVGDTVVGQKNRFGTITSVDWPVVTTAVGS